MIGNRRILTAFAMAAVILTAAVAGPAVSPTAAQSDDDSVIDTLFGEDEGGEDTSTTDTVLSYVGGMVERVSPFADQPAEADASEYVEDTQSEFNQNNGSLENWTNTRSNASTDYDVIRFKFTDESGNSKFVFLVSDVDSGNYTNSRMMGLSEFKQTDRSHDLTYRLSPFASRNAADELETFVSEYAEPGEDLNQTDLARLAGKFRGEIDGDELPGEN